MPNNFKGKHQPKARKSEVPQNEPGRIIRRFLDSTPSNIYPGCLGNSEFVKSLGYVRQGSVSSLANAWMNGKPIPARTLIKITEIYPEFPLREYLKAYVEEYPDSSSVVLDTFELTLILLERHKANTERLMDDYNTMPTTGPSSSNPELLLEDEFAPFHEDWLAEKSPHELPDPTKEEKSKQREKFKKDMRKGKG